MLGMISTAKHKRIVAEKDAEIAGLMKRLKATKQSQRDIWQAYCGADNEARQLRARLAPFTKIRNRDSRGRFIKD